MAQLAHRRTTLPELAEIDRLRVELAGVRSQRVAAETQLTDIRREQDKFEADIAQVRQRMARDQERMDTGAVGSAKELESLQHEIDSLRRRQSDLEDGELEVMERLDELETAVRGMSAQESELAEALAATEAARDATLAQLQQEAAQTSADRERMAPEIPADLLALYDKLRGQYSGVGAAALRQRRCEGCRLELNTTDLGHVREAADDDVLRCEECRRILVRTDESGL